jgi:exoribonuclease R
MSNKLSIVGHYNNGGLVEIDKGKFIYIEHKHLNHCFDGDIVIVEKLTDPVSKEEINQLQDNLNQKIEIVGKGICQIKSNSSNSSLMRLPGVLKIKSTTVYTKQTTNKSKRKSKKVTRMYQFKPSDPKWPKFLVGSKIDPNKFKKNIYVVIQPMDWDEDNLMPRGQIQSVIGEVGVYENEIMCRLYRHNLYFNMGGIVPPLEPISPSDTNDLRDRRVYSIDPPGCMDVDDAIHIETLGDGHIRLGIHIADVSHFVRPGTNIDDLARKKTTSIYLPHQVRHMLPAKLSEGVCSLLAGQDRRALSLMLDFDTKGQIVSKKFEETIIRNKKQLTYEKAESIIDEKESHDISKVFHMLYTYKGEPELFGDSPKSHFLIETCMILANVTCAEFLREHCDQFVLRTHKVSPLDPSYGVIIQKYLKRKAQNAAEYRLVKKGDSDVAHSGLDVKYYTHFTSPIRRYIDIINHRMIKSIINKEEFKLDEDLIVVNRSNNINARIRKLDSDLAFLKIIQDLEKCKEEQIICDAYIVDLGINSPSLKIRIYLPEYQLTKLLTVCHYDTLHLFDIVHIQGEKIVLIDKLTGLNNVFHLYGTIKVSLTPILTSDDFNKKLRINLVNFS